MLSSNHSPLFSPKNPDHAAKLQMHEELKCMVILSLMLAKIEIDEINEKEKRKAEAAKLPPLNTNDPNVIKISGAHVIHVPTSPAYGEILKFDSLLITRPRREAIKAGEAFVKTIRELIPASIADVVLAGSYATFLAEYDGCDERGDQEEIAGMIAIQSKSRAFMMMRELLDKLKPDMIAALKPELEVALFRTMHYGDADMLDYLLDKGVNPNLINTDDFIGKYRPLNLLMYDMDRCIQLSHALMEKAQSGADVSRGTYDELRQFLAARIHADKKMVASLLAHGADPDHAPEEHLACKQPPRETAAAKLNMINLSLENKDGTLRGYELEDCIAEKIVLELIINAPKLVNTPTESAPARLAI